MKKGERFRSITGLVIFLALSYGAAASVSWIGQRDLFDILEKPLWTPPAWVFGPVWTVLYGLIGVSGWIVWWEAGLEVARVALSFWLIQLVLNALWVVIFFGFGLIGWAVLEIIVLWAAILATTLLFLRHNHVASILMVPYLFWVSFAGVLNFQIWILNR